ncbi:flavodoxin domain-containing protein [Halopseudomonas salina]|uniref:Flavodoxin-like domain-containing protein n=1 Tax=Halopseudomonas salina TaxID=1323744 RepID=A0ABQ1PSV3_9GAMM|nr:flavodoxin domain-containing protein [Halopseudomonas salina]GGD03154.1 hypothetical protein GCM10007418_22900 [Halopseudomonas salina]
MPILNVMQNVGAERVGWALLVTLLWVIVCLWSWHCSRRKAAPAEAPWLVAYASQNGTAETLARATLAQIQSLGEAPPTAQLLPLNSVKRGHLRRCRRMLLVVSTTGQGAAPENARQFFQRFLCKSLDLSHLEYAVLGLGDRRYKRFCACAEDLDDWLAAQGATRTFTALKADRSDPRTLAQWHENIALTLAPGETSNLDAPA